MRFKRKISFRKFNNNNDIDVYWMLIWYGAITFDKKEREFYIDAYFIKTKKQNKEFNYFFSNMDVSSVEKLKINLKKSFLFPLGSIFDFIGKLAYMPNGKSRGIKQNEKTIYYKNNIKLLNELDLIDSNLFKLINEIDSNLINESCTYYSNSKSENFRFIIPNYVLFKYYYFYSGSLLNNIINNDLESNISKFKIEDEDIVFFNSKVIQEFDVKFIGKYFFTFGNSGIKTINEISNELFRLKISKKKENKFYFKNVIPFMFLINYSTNGFYIDYKENGLKVFMVSDIVSTSKIDSNYKYFTQEKVKYVDINKLNKNNNSKDNNGNNDSNPIQNKPEIDVNPNIKDLLIDNPDFQPIIDKIENIDSNLFSDEIKFEEIVNDDLKKIKIYIGENQWIRVRVNNLNTNISKEELINYIYVHLKYFILTQRAIDLLKAEGYQIIKLNQVEINQSVCEIYEINYNSCYYYLLEKGRGSYSAIIRKNDYSKFVYEELYSIIRIATEKHSFNWSIIKHRNLFNNRNIFVLTPNKHKIAINDNLEVDIEQTIIRLKDKVLKKIKTDYDLL